MSEITIGTRMTIEEFKQIPESMERIEFIEGEIFVSPTPKFPHQDTTFSTAKVIDKLMPGGKVVVSPMDVYITDSLVLQPDVFWISGGESLCQLGDDGYWHGAPDLVVEVASPSTVSRDRGVKFKLYEQHGVREYWLMDPIAKFIEVYVLREEQFVRLGLYEIEQTFKSPVLGVDIPVKELFGS